MSTEDSLKLTTYFAESGRTEDGFVSGDLIDISESARLEASIVFRGAEGFGSRQHLRTDRFEVLSADLPLVSIAVDTRPRIEALLNQVSQPHSSGLLTLEPTCMLSGEFGEIALPEVLNEATKLTVFVGREEMVYGVPAFAAVCDLLYRRGIEGATALLGIDGTMRGVRERVGFFGSNPQVPMMVIAVGSSEMIGRVLPELGGLLRRPLVTLEAVRICKRAGELIERPRATPMKNEHGTEVWQKLVVYTSALASGGNPPLHVELVHRLRRSGASGATALRGIWGFRGDRAPHGERKWQIRRDVPMVSILIDTPERIARSFEIVDELTDQRGFVTSEMVPVVRSATSDH